jgi:hypothetical protein
MMEAQLRATVQFFIISRLKGGEEEEEEEEEDTPGMKSPALKMLPESLALKCFRVSHHGGRSFGTPGVHQLTEV